MPTVTVKFKQPDYNRKTFTDLLIASKEIVPFTNYALLIDHQFFYSHESDVEEALEERFNHEWGTRKYALAAREAEYWRKEFRNEENNDKLLDGLPYKKSIISKSAAVDHQVNCIVFIIIGKFSNSDNPFSDFI